ncbi:MAG: cytochrome C oxidase subunit IV family protein [Desulfobacterales bacterium]|jgi:caa(3)-type oxidase subunit IV|nr:cytochrome C oxidase subunit IV family protein [Desulfobacterales bacterium]
MSNNVFRLPATRVWLTLMAVTILSWWLAEHQANPAKIAATAVILIAAFKVRLVFIYFMELKWKPKPWRVVYELWTVAITVIIVGAYWLSELL